MRSLEEVTAIEDEHAREGAKTLGLAYEWLLERWFAGARDRETLLRLLFLRWYLLVEPPFLTGATSELITNEELDRQLQDHFSDVEADAEICSIVRIMVDVADWALPGQEALWHRLAGDGISEQIEVSIFDDRGAYGWYFAHMVAGTQSLSF